MRDAKGLLFLTVGKVAFGAGFHVGSGLIVVRLGEKNTSTQHDQQQQHPSGGGGSGGGGGKRGGSTPEGVLSGLVKDWQGGGGGVQWSAPCAVGRFGLSVGIEAGLETTDMVSES
jgi:lipid-binding SYLF domain-containing protein